MKLICLTSTKGWDCGSRSREAGKSLERMGYACQDGEVSIPAYRADILHQVDLIEDIAIAYGYENFPKRYLM